MKLPQLERMAIGHRIMLSLAIVLILLFALALFGWLTGGWEEGAQAAPAPTSELYAGIPRDEHLLTLDKRALDEAYHQQILLLFSTWLKNASGDEKKAVTYFQNGLRNTRSAFSQAAAQIAKREQEMQSK